MGLVLSVLNSEIGFACLDDKKSDDITDACPLEVQHNERIRIVFSTHNNVKTNNQQLDKTKIHDIRLSQHDPIDLTARKLKIANYISTLCNAF